DESYPLRGASMTPETSYRLIPLTQGQFAKVSPHRFEELSRFKWCSHWNPHTESFYAKRSVVINGKQNTMFMHRVILGLSYDDPRRGDHRNQDTLDNQDENLRIATNSQNASNSRMKKS